MNTSSPELQLPELQLHFQLVTQEMSLKELNAQTDQIIWPILLRNFVGKEVKTVPLPPLTPDQVPDTQLVTYLDEASTSAQYYFLVFNLAFVGECLNTCSLLISCADLSVALHKKSGGKIRGLVRGIFVADNKKQIGNYYIHSVSTFSP